MAAFTTYTEFSPRRTTCFLCAVWLRNLLGGAGEAIHAANFTAQKPKKRQIAGTLTAEQYDLLSARGRRLDGRIGAQLLHPQRGWFADADDAFFDGSVDVVDGEDVVDRGELMASAGMPKITEVASSCARTMPPADLMALAPFAPSLPMPVRTDADAHGSGVSRDGFHGDVDICR